MLKIVEMNTGEIKEIAMKTSEHQNWFKVKKSCSSAIVKLYEYLRGLPKGNKKNSTRGDVGGL